MRPLLTQKIISGEVGGVNPVLVRAANHGRDADSSRVLFCEARAGTFRTIPSVTVFGKGDLIGSCITTAPLYPARRIDDVRKSSVLENHACIVPPGATEVVSASLDSVARSSRDLGLIDDIVGGVRVGVATIGRNITLRGSKNTNVDAVEPGGGLLSKYEVRSTCALLVYGQLNCVPVCITFNVRLSIDLVAGLGQNRVLEAFELTAVVALLVGIGTESKSLRARTTRIDEVNVVNLEVG